MRGEEGRCPSLDWVHRRCGIKASRCVRWDRPEERDPGPADAAQRASEGWDTAGQERYQRRAPMYYRGAAAAVVAVYDITNTDSYIRTKRWVDELQRQGNPDLVMALVGNKVNFENKRKVGTQKALEYVERNGLFFLEMPASSSTS